jgi:hypothetical protein
VEGVLARRLAGQRISAPVTTVVDAVRLACGLQAQDEQAVALGVRARTTGLHATDVEAAMASGSVVRTWTVRGTLHLVTAEDAAWMVPLLGPLFDAKAHRRQAELGLDARSLAAGTKLVLEAVGTDGIERRALFRQPGLKLEGQARIHLLAHVARQGLVHFADGDRVVPGKRAPLPRDEALGRLAKGYRAAFGPADARDFAAWSGLGAADVKIAWSAAGDSPFPEAQPVPAARLLGAFDNTLLGWRDRSFLLPASFAAWIHPGSGLIHPAILVGGEVRGRWRRSDMSLELFARLSVKERKAVDAEVADVRRFLAQ